MVLTSCLHACFGDGDKRYMEFISGGAHQVLARLPRGQLV
jgi:hypothetical protein